MAKKPRGFTDLNYHTQKFFKHNLKNKQNISLLFDLSKNWPEIIGQDFNQFCRPSKIILNQKQGSANLQITAFNSSIAFYLQSDTSNIIKKINYYFGYNLIAKISVKTVPKIIKTNQENDTQKPISSEKIAQISQITTKIKDSSLQEKLNNLGKNLIND